MTPVATVQIGDRIWRTLTPVVWFDLRIGRRIVIPAGYEFDLASVPRGMWWLIAPFELSTLAPLVHDYLYERKGRIRCTRLSRRQVDKVFLRIMKHERIGRTRRTLAYMAVRAFGWIYWNRHKDIETCSKQLHDRDRSET